MYKWNLWILIFTQIWGLNILTSRAIEFPKNETSYSEDLYDADAFKEWIALDKNLKTITSSAMKSILPVLMDNMGTLNLSSQCKKDSIQVIAGVKRLKEWALKLLDSSGKMIDGFLQGKLFALGDYRECTSIVATKSSAQAKKQVLFKGQYCTIRALPRLPVKKNILRLKNGMHQLGNFTKSVTDLTRIIYENADMLSQPELALQLGLCFPSGCTVDDINEFVGQVGEKVMMTAKVERCEIKSEKTRFDKYFIIAIIFYSLATFLALVGSLLELYSSKNDIQFKSVGLRVFLAFSLMKNFKKLINTEKSKESISCLNGIRFLTMTWILTSHTIFILFSSSSVTANLNSLPEITSQLGMQILTNGFLAVETFFFVSGLLNSYIRIKEMDEKKKQRNIIFLLIHRFWRILPVYIYTILFLFLFEHAVSGPHYQKSYLDLKRNCEKSWWTNLLFLQNFLVDFTDTCIPQAWYLACDFQLFIVALFTVDIFIKRPKIGIAINSILILLSIVYGGLWIRIFNYSPTFIFYGSNLKKIVDYSFVYTKPFIHAGSYFIGVLSGYFLTKHKNIKIPKKIQVLCWTLSVCFACSSLFGTKGWNSGEEPTELETIFYSGLSKVAFTLAIAWIVICCVTGHGGIINSILSWSAWTPLSRLTFTIYLLSPLVQCLIIANTKIGFDFDVLIVVYRAMGDLIFSTMAALTVTLLVEAPFMSLEKVILLRDKQETNNITKSMYTNAAYEVEANGEKQPSENKL